ncbi:MAG: hypothetical protein N2511_00700 [Thermodesulfovibrionales bacterium]|nr:hypothetical protein [Thermodesulfovibrionales bacterium]
MHKALPIERPKGIFRKVQYKILTPKESVKRLLEALKVRVLEALPH